MKIILHMGTPKTGSTSLQMGLNRIRNELLKEGVFYPVSPEIIFYSHHLLIALFGKTEFMEVFQIRDFGSQENLLQLTRRFLSEIKENAGKMGCHTIVLSSELTFPGHPGKDPHKLVQSLKEISPDIEPVVYVREPASMYQSQIQQRAKGGNFLKPPNRTNIRTGLEKIEEAFQRLPTVRAFDRKQLTNGDILDDFCSEVLGLKQLGPCLPRIEENVSLSAEVTSTLIAYNKFVETMPDEEGKKRRAYVSRRITEFVDKENYLTKLSLNPEVSKAIRESADDFAWLRDKFSIEFEELEYAKIKSGNRKLLNCFEKPNDIFDSDPQKQLWLLFSILNNARFPEQERPPKHIIMKNKAKKQLERIRRFFRRIASSIKRRLKL